MSNMSNQSEVTKKKKELSERLDQLIVELKELHKAFAASRKNSKHIIKKAHEKKDENTIQALRKKMGL